MRSPDLVSSVITCSAVAVMPFGTFEELFEHSMRFLASPSKIWNLGALEYKKLVLRLTFAEHLVYCPIEGFRTPKTTLPFKVLDEFFGAAAGTGAP